MKGLAFCQETVPAVLNGTKNVTRRIKRSDKPPYKVGEIVYVKEAWRCVSFDCGRVVVEYAGGFEERTVPTRLPVKIGLPWRSPRFMPEWASRKKLRIVSCTEERLQDITAAECRREGIDEDSLHCYGPACPSTCNTLGCQGDRELFEEIWNRLHPKPPDDWDSNPFVWRIEWEDAASTRL